MIMRLLQTSVASAYSKPRLSGSAIFINWFLFVFAATLVTLTGAFRISG